MKWITFFAVVFWAILLLSPQPGVAQGKGTVGSTFHATIGEVVDATENTQYNIFGDLPGFTAARLHPQSNYTYHVRLYRNGAEGGQFLLIRMPTEGARKFLVDLDKRIQTVQTGEAIPTTPVYPKVGVEWSDPALVKKFVLHDGSSLNGTIKRLQTDTLFVETPAGLQIPVSDALIVEIDDIGGQIVAGRFQRTDPNTTRLFFSPTGRGLKARHGYFADYMLFFPTVAIGLSDYFAISGGMSIIPGSNTQLLYFAPKLSLPFSQNADFSVGLLYLAIPYDVEDLKLGFAVATFGNNHNALTLGGGLPLNADDSRDFLIIAGGETQLSNSMKLISENYIFSGGGDSPILFSLGLRFFGEKLAVDFAFFTTKEALTSNGWPFVPWLDFSVAFGK